MQKIIAVPGATDVAGLITFWTLSGSVEYATLGTEWSGAGHDIEVLPRETTYMEALRRAMQHIKPRNFIRSVEQEKRRGYVLVDEEKRAGLPTFSNNTIITLNEDDHLVIDRRSNYTDEILSRYKVELRTITSHDMSSWLISLVESVGGIRLRESGGIYFVPQTSADTWRAYVACIRTCTQHTVYEVPAMRSDEAVRTILDALTAEAEASVSEVFGVLEKAQSKLNTKSVNARTKQCAALIAKLETYENLLGTQLDTIKTRVLECQTAVTAAAVVSLAS